MAKDVYIIPYSGSIDFKNNDISYQKIYLDDSDNLVFSGSDNVYINNGTVSASILYGDGSNLININVSAGTGSYWTGSAGYISRESDVKITGSLFVINNSADVINFQNNALRIDNIGRVGINTNNPTVGLHIYDVSIRQQNNSPLGEQIYYQLGRYGTLFDWNEDGNTSGATKYRTILGQNVYVSSGSANEFSQLNSYLNKYALQISNNTGFHFLYRVGSSGGSDSWNYDEFTDLMTLYYSGRVGIGSTTPAAKLYVFESASSANSELARFYRGDNTTVGIQFRSTDLDDDGLHGIDYENEIASYNANSFNIYTLSSNPLVLGTNSTEQMRIAGDGKVGIGNVNPSQELTVEGNISASGNAYFDGNLVLNNLQISNNVISGVNEIYAANGDENDPSYTFTSNTGTGLGRRSSTNNLFLSTNSTGAMWIDESQNVGIGTDQQVDRLTVKGSGSFSEELGIGVSGSDIDAQLHVYSTTTGSRAFLVEGQNGVLFQVLDELSGSLFGVSDISGLPILEVFDDDKVVMGRFNENTLVVTGSEIYSQDQKGLSMTMNITGSDGTHNLTFTNGLLTGYTIT